MGGSIKSKTGEGIVNQPLGYKAITNFMYRGGEKLS